MTMLEKVTLELKVDMGHAPLRTIRWKIAAFLVAVAERIAKTEFKIEVK